MWGKKEDEFHMDKKAEFHVAAELPKTGLIQKIIERRNISLIVRCYIITSTIKYDGASIICLDKNEHAINKSNKQIHVLHTTIDLTYS